jgi:hypothetical protein
MSPSLGISGDRRSKKSLPYLRMPNSTIVASMNIVIAIPLPAPWKVLYYAITVLPGTRRPCADRPASLGDSE